MSNESDATVYANQLLQRCHGWPLWFPDRPQQPHDVEIGDVGYVDPDGAFVRLFRATEKAEHPVNKEGVPVGFHKLDFSNRVLDEKDNYLDAQPVCSRTVESLGGGLGAGSDVASTKLQYSFACSADQGAFLVLKDRAAKRAVQSNKRFPRYMKQHHLSWNALAIKDELLIDKESIILVHGWVKTSDWAVGAFTRNVKSHQVSVTGNFATFANAGFQFDVTKAYAGSIGRRTGPDRKRNSAFLSPPNTPDPSKSQTSIQSVETGLPLNQCVFLLRYKIKYRRFLPNKITAGAGYDKLPDGERDGDEDVVVESDVSSPVYNDPLDILLNYILEFGEGAEVAITSDGELIDLLQSHGLDTTDGLFGFLQETRPTVDVDEGIATLSVSESILQVHQTRTALANHNFPNPNANPPTHPEDKTALLKTAAATAAIAGTNVNASTTTSSGCPSLLLREASKNSGPIDALALSPTAHLLAGGYQDGIIRVWDYTTGQLHACLQAPNNDSSLSSVTFSLDGNEVVAGAADGTVFIWAVGIDNEKPRVTKKEHEGDIWCIAFSPDGKHFATASLDATIGIWDAEQGTVIQLLGKEGLEHCGGVQFVQFSPKQGSTHLIAFADAVGYIWDWTTGVLVAKMEGHTDVIWSMSYSKDGTRVATASEDQSSRIWNSEDGIELVTLHEHTDAVWAVDFSPDGKHVLSASSDSTVAICDTMTGQRVHLLREEPAVVAAAKYTADGQYVVSGCADGTVKVWDVDRNGALVMSLKTHVDKVKTVSISHDDNWVVSTSDDGFIGVSSLVDVLRLWSGSAVAS